MQIYGNVIAGGIAMGKLCFQHTDYDRFLKAYRPARADIEKIRFDNAVSQAKQDLNELIAAGRTTKEGLDILKSHLAIVIHPSLENMVFCIDENSAPNFCFTFTVISSPSTIFKFLINFLYSFNSLSLYLKVPIFI